MNIEIIKACIRDNDMHRFYGTYEWQQAARAARQQQHNECQRCRAKGLYAPCEVVHHIRSVKEFPELALDISNLECLCRPCHEAEHERAAKEPKGFVNAERW